MTARDVIDPCVCCGRDWPNHPDCRTDRGSIHFSCWDEHHSDPTGAWPPDHVCKAAPDPDLNEPAEEEA